MKYICPVHHQCESLVCIHRHPHDLEGDDFCDGGTCSMGRPEMPKVEVDGCVPMGLRYYAQKKKGA